MSQKKITTNKNKLKNEKQTEVVYNQDVAQNKIERKTKRNASFHNGSNEKLNKSALISESFINQQDNLSQSRKKKIQFKENAKSKEQFKEDKWDYQQDKLNNYSLDLIPITPTKLKDFLRSPSNNFSENIEGLQQSSAKKSILGNSVILFKSHLQQNIPQQKGILQDLITNNNSLEIDELFSSTKQSARHCGLSESFYEVNCYNKSSRNDLESYKKRDQSEDNLKKSILKKQKHQKNDGSLDNKENSLNSTSHKDKSQMNNINGQQSINNRSYVKQQINILKEKSNIDFSQLKQNFQDDIEIGEKQVKNQIQKLQNFLIQNLSQIEQVKQKIEATQDNFSSIDRHVLNNYQFFQEVPHFLDKNMNFNKEQLEQQLSFFQNAYVKQLESAIQDLQTKKIRQNKSEVENLEKQIKDVIMKNEYLVQENKILKNNNQNSLQNTTIELNLSNKKNNSMIFIGDDIQTQNNGDYLLKKENKKLQNKVDELMNEINETSRINENIQQNQQNQIMRNEAELYELRQENQQLIKDLQQIESEYSKKINHLEQQIKNLQRIASDKDERNYHVNTQLTNQNLLNQIKILNGTLEEKEQIRLKQKGDFEYASDIMTQEIVKLKKEIKYQILEKEQIQRKYSELVGQTKQLEAYVNQNEQLIRQLKQKEEYVEHLITIIKEIKVKSKEMGFDRYLKCYFKKVNISDNGQTNEKKPFKI